ncbi:MULTISPECIES: penicillin-binding protein activator [Pseudoalteromonas]|uniref:penicillin-binding protein activator n=1 Tax=Pseudoalteromonas TaxID=53246 RepID=UPI0007866D03|nr:penicillin-binding protein activator [Pseudoalteromonas arabiensis]MCF7517476.1 penicillin-binding protein activator [Pseudoalteromonas sp. L21]UJX25131.1 penicillin-binding protein activator [Pseudoalteromonas sp. CF6-2]
MRLKLVSLLIVLSGLSACSTTEKPSNSTENPSSQSSSALSQLTDAQSMYQTALNRQGADKIQLLYTARDAAISEERWSLLENICLELEATPSVDQIQNKLYIALAQEQQGKSDLALEQLRVLEPELSLPEHKAWHQYLTGRVYASQGLPKQAMPYYFAASTISNDNNFSVANLNQDLWHSLTQLSSYALERFNRGSVVQQGWVNLALYHQVYLGAPVELHQAMNNWMRRYPGHPAAEVLPKKVTELVQVEPLNVNRLAVLIPQSGANERLGDALKAGVLAALDNNPLEETLFIDESLSAAEIALKLSEFKADFVIGPLLKSNIEKLSTAQTLIDYPVMHLNTFDGERVSQQHFFFALNPEHEVQQALERFLTAGYQKPMLLAPNNSNGQRLVEYFNQQWQRYSEVKPQVGFYASKDDMPKTITGLLEVDQSKERIKVVKSLFRQEVESETRSRSDVDVIYILGDATETRLIKPYLDVNVSTFAERIPLYASSKSHSKQIDRTDKGDLDGLYFTELPWMLEGQIKQHNLRQQYERLWPENADINQRLFAMTYDATSMLGSVKQLSMVAGKRFNGISGELSIASNGHVTRSLDWAQYKNKQIIAVDLATEQPIPLFMQSASGISSAE